MTEILWMVFCLKCLLFDVSRLPERHAGQEIFNKYLATADVKEISRLDDLMDEVLKGNTGILAAGMSKAIVVSSKALPGRGVTEAETEVSVRGSKESFTESFRTNTVLIRRRIRDTRLKSKQMTIGVRFKRMCINVYGRSGSAFRSAGSAQSVGKL